MLFLALLAAQPLKEAAGMLPRCGEEVTPNLRQLGGVRAVEPAAGTAPEEGGVRVTGAEAEAEADAGAEVEAGAEVGVVATAAAVEAAAAAATSTWPPL